MSQLIGSFSTAKFRVLMAKKRSDLQGANPSSLNARNFRDRMMHIVEDNCQCTEGPCKWTREMLYHDCEPGRAERAECFECLGLAANYWNHVSFCAEQVCGLPLCKEMRRVAFEELMKVDSMRQIYNEMEDEADEADEEEPSELLGHESVYNEVVNRANARTAAARASRLSGSLPGTRSTAGLFLRRQDTVSRMQNARRLREAGRPAVPSPLSFPSPRANVIAKKSADSEDVHLELWDLTTAENRETYAREMSKPSEQPNPFGIPAPMSRPLPVVTRYGHFTGISNRSSSGGSSASSSSSSSSSDRNAVER